MGTSGNHAKFSSFSLEIRSQLIAQVGFELLNILFIYEYECFCLRICLCPACMPGVCGEQKR